MEQHNADAQDAVTRFDGAEASAPSRLQDGTAATADYAHVADTYAQLQETWEEDPGNNLVQIPVAGSVQPLTPEAYFERQERLYRRLAGETASAEEAEEAARVAATPAAQLEDPEGGVDPTPSPRVVYNRVTAGGELVQESTTGSTEYVNAATGEQVGYQTERGDVAINRRLIPKPSYVYPTVTHGGEYVQESTAPGTQYADPEGRIMVRETHRGLPDHNSAPAYSTRRQHRPLTPQSRSRPLSPFPILTPRPRLRLRGKSLRWWTSR